MTTPKCMPPDEVFDELAKKQWSHDEWVGVRYIRFARDCALAAVEAYKRTPEARRDRAIAQAVDEWRPSPPHDGDLCQRAEADAKLRMMRRADELLKSDATSPSQSD